MNEWIYLAFAVLGTVVCAWWIGVCATALHRVYRSRTNGMKELLTWSQLVEGVLLLGPQVLWLISALVLLFYPVVDESARPAVAIRGTLGSLFILVIVALKHWTWTRVQALAAERDPR